jgi:hypothetical protein
MTNVDDILDQKNKTTLNEYFICKLKKKNTHLDFYDYIIFIVNYCEYN